jgi:hypothetical protein
MGRQASKGYSEREFEVAVESGQTLENSKDTQKCSKIVVGKVIKK